MTNTLESAKKSSETPEQRKIRLKKVVARAKANKKNQQLRKTGKKIIAKELKKAGKRKSAGSAKTTATTSRTKKKTTLPKSKIGATVANRSRKINAAVNRAGG